MTPSPWAGLVAAAFFVAAARGQGRWLAGRLGVGLAAEVEFLAGAALLSVAVFALGVAGWLAPGLLLAVGLWSAWRGRWTPAEIPWREALVLTPCGLLYLVQAMTPEISPDGVAYHWHLPSRYLRERALVGDETSIYAWFPQAMEMLYAFGLAFARRSPALIHLAFLWCLAGMMLREARAAGRWRVAVPAALLLVATPVVGVDAASAYNDVALAAAGFGVYVLVEQWRGGAERRDELLLVAGLLAGFAMGLKYTGVLALVYLVGILIRARVTPETSARVLGLAAVPIVPWLLRNAVLTGNPLAPFANALFPNPVFDPALEQNWLANLSWAASGVPWKEWPAELCLRGEKLRGLLGPAFLLAPVALIALRGVAGRRWAMPAGLFLLPLLFNAGTRFAIPALPFWSLMLTTAIAPVPGAPWALAAGQAVAAWPGVMDRYAERYAWRIREVPWAAALGLENEAAYLQRRLPVTGLREALDRAPGPVLALSPYPEAYTQAHIWTVNHSRAAAEAGRVVWALSIPKARPATRFRFWFPERELAGLRVVQTAGPPLAVGEVRLYHLLEEIPLEAAAVRSEPNRFRGDRAVDGAVFTRWTSWTQAGPLAELDIALRTPVRVSRVEIDVDGLDPLPALRIDGRAAGAPWSLAAEHFEVVQGIGEGLDAWQEAMRGLWASGVRGVLVQDSDYQLFNARAIDREERRAGWAYRRVAEAAGARLYEISRVP